MTREGYVTSTNN